MLLASPISIGSHFGKKSYMDFFFPSFYLCLEIKKLTSVEKIFLGGSKVLLRPQSAVNMNTEHELVIF